MTLDQLKLRLRRCNALGLALLVLETLASRVEILRLNLVHCCGGGGGGRRGRALFRVRLTDVPGHEEFV